MHEPLDRLRHLARHFARSRMARDERPLAMRTALDSAILLALCPGHDKPGPELARLAYLRTLNA